MGALDSLFQPAAKKVEQKSTVTTKAPPKVSNTSLNKDRVARGPAGVTCQVCHKVKCPNMETMRSHLTFHPHAQCVGKVNICYICDDKFDIRSRWKIKNKVCPEISGKLNMDLQVQVLGFC